MNHLKIAITELEDMFYKQEDRFLNPLKSKKINNAFKNVIEAHFLIERMNVLGNIEYSMNMYPNQYNQKHLSKNQKELFEKSQPILERSRNKIIDLIDGYDQLCVYLNSSMSKPLSIEEFELKEASVSRKSLLLNNNTHLLLKKLKEESKIFTQHLLSTEDWVTREFSHNSLEPKALTKKELFLLIDRFDGYVESCEEASEKKGVYNYNCVFKSSFDEKRFLMSLHTEKTEKEIDDMLK